MRPLTSSSRWHLASGDPSAVAAFLAVGFHPLLHDPEPVTAGAFLQEALDSFEGIEISASTVARMARKGWIRPVASGPVTEGRGRTTYFLRRDLIPAFYLHLMKHAGAPDRWARGILDSHVELSDENYAPMLLAHLVSEIATRGRASSDLEQHYAKQAGPCRPSAELAAAHIVRAGTTAMHDVLCQCIYFEIAAGAPSAPPPDRLPKLVRDLNIFGLGDIQARYREAPRSLKVERSLRLAVDAAFIEWLRTPPGEFVRQAKADA